MQNSSETTHGVIRPLAVQSNEPNGKSDREHTKI